MEKGVNFFEQLPVETCYQILNRLYREWRKLRLVSKQWNVLCQKLIWRNVSIMPVRYRMGAVPFEPLYLQLGNYNPFNLRYDCERAKRPIVLTYQQIRELAPDRQFQNALENVIELYIYYDHTGERSEEECVETFGLIPELFTAVNKLKLDYYPGLSDKRAPAFQKMLNKWKRTVDICLQLTSIIDPAGDATYIDTDGMKISELHVSRYVDYAVDGVPLLPLTRTKDKTPIQLADLPSLSKYLDTLSIETDSNIFDCNWIPDTIKHLHLSNQQGEFASGPKLVVPRQVEYLYIEENFEFDEYAGESTDDTMTILACVDLKRATQLKVMSYRGNDVSSQLIRAVLEIKDTLETLTIRSKTVTRYNTYRFRELAHAGLGVKQLRLSTSSFGPLISDYHDFMGGFPELNQLQLDLEGYPLLVGEEIYLEADVWRSVLSEFLRGCPKLSHIQLLFPANEERGITWEPWITPCDEPTDPMHIVDISKARSYFTQNFFGNQL
ncbi:hypothetical protein TRVA0_013S02366 [Trichomonascus vanleenenianus]|uniref:F-box protein n=1 Tax=Trichomonascus vanleenenianus TaxID=2268995 RepID=UPI003ECAD5C2